MKSSIAALAFVGLMLHAVPASAQVMAGAAEKFDSTAIDLEDLDKIDVRSVSRRDQQLFRAPSAVYSINSEQIRRSGARSIPELLRMVPGLDVAQLDGGGWTVSARGFAGRTNNALLVVIDGRPIYSPTSSGLRWEMEPFPIEDIERIEVVRGASAVGFGANAINGVINILTKTAHSTDGWLLSAYSGTPSEGSGMVRYAHKTATNRNFRVWANLDAHPGGSLSKVATDQSRIASAGLRADLKLTPRTDLEIDALVGDGRLASPNANEPGELSLTTPRSHASRAFLLGRWEFDPTGNSAVSELVVQVFVDANRHEVFAFSSDHDVYEAEVRHRLPAGRHQEITWGGGHRTMVARSSGTGSGFADRRVDLSNMAVQDVVAIIPTKLTMTVGARLSHHSAAGFLFDPEMRWAWSRTARQTLWTAVSHASRPPSLAAQPHEAYFSPLLRADELLTTGRVTAFESGYRFEPVAHLMLDTAMFFNTYRDADIGSTTRGTTYGIETLARWDPVPMWAVEGWYSGFRARLQAPVSLSSAGTRLNSPSHQWHARSRLTVRGIDFDATFGVSADIPYAGADAYRRLDFRVGRRVAHGLELSFAGRNLLGSSHSDSSTLGLGETRFFSRNAGLKATWQF